MNIGFLINRYPGVGGIENITTLLSQLFKNKLGHSVSIFSVYQQDDLEIDSTLKEIDIVKATSLVKQTIIYDFIKYLEEKSLDIIIFQDSYANIEYLLDYVNHSTKIITVEHNTPNCFLIGYTHYVKTLKSRTLKGLIRKLIFPISWAKIYLNQGNRHKNLVRRSDYYIVLSKSYINILKSLWNISSSNILAIPNIINNYNLICKDCSYNKKKQVLFVGRLTKQKGIEMLMHIWQEIEIRNIEYELIILGDGEERIYIESYIRKYGLKRVHLEGFRDNVFDYYQETSVIFLTSVFEGFGLVLPEAMQFGVIPFAFDSYTALTDIVKDGHDGFIISSFDVKSYVDAFERFTKMSDAEVENLRGNAKTSSSKFSPDVVLIQWDKLLNSINESHIPY